jgi:hypothetical protein
MTPSWRRGRVAAGPEVVFLAADPIVEAGKDQSQFLDFLARIIGIALVL